MRTKIKLFVDSNYQDNSKIEAQEQKLKYIQVLIIYFQFMNFMMQSILVWKMFFCCCVKEDNIEDYQIAHGSKDHKHKINRPCSDMKVCQNEFNKPVTLKSSLLTQQSNKDHQRDNKKDSMKDTNCSNKKSLQAQVPKSMKLSRKDDVDQSQNSKPKSQLWQAQYGCKIFFSNHRVDQQMIFTYEITRFISNEKSLINYALNTSKNNCKTSSDSQQIFLCLVLTSGGVSKLRNITKDIELRSYILPIYGIYRQQQDYNIIKSTNFHNNKFDVTLIAENSFRIKSFDRIIISTITESTFQMILTYIQKVTQSYSLDDMVKIELLLPNWVSLHQISTILLKLYRKFVLGEQLNSIIRYLHFSIELIESNYFEPTISIKNSLHISKPKRNLKNIFEMKLLCAINLVPIAIEYTNFEILKKMINILQENFTLIKYLKLSYILSQDERHFISNLEELKLFDKSQLLQIQSSTKTNRKSISDEESYMLISNKNNAKIEEMFRRYSQTKMYAKSSFKKKKEWDDDLNADDIQITFKHADTVINEACAILLDAQQSSIYSPDLTFCQQIEILEI